MLYNRLKVGREDANGRPNTSATDENIEAVNKMILANRRITIREVANAVRLTYCSAHVKQFLDMKCAAANIVPILNFDQK